MSAATGTATIDFGTHPGSNEASANVTGQAGILSTAKVDAWVMADDSTGNHPAADHRYFGALAALSCGTPTTGVGFTIYARSTQRLTGQWALRWVWIN